MTVPPERIARLVPTLWSVLLVGLLLGPALAPGYVLLRDMVWVPDLALREDTLGLGSGLPRAVPSDAVVAVLDEVLPGWLLQKLMLAGSLLGAAAGVLRLVPAGLLARTVAVTFAVWNPFVVERLAMGHWPVLLGYAAVPWLAHAGIRAAREGRVAPSTYPLLVVGSLSANAGLVSAAVLLATGARRRRTTLTLLLACVAANAPWLVAGAAHVGEAAGSGGYDVFSTRADGLPGPLTVLTLGGIWNADTVPASREQWPVWIGLAWLLALAAAGVRRWLRGTDRPEVLALVALWLLGYGIAVTSWASPDALARLGDQVPGLAVLRDGSRMLALCLPLTVVLLGHGAQALSERLASWRPSRVALVAASVAVALLPLAVMPDAAGGAGGQLRAVRFPDDWSEVRRIVATSTHPGDVLLLPLSNFRAPAWNDGRPVLDPLGRFLTREVLMDDDLVIGGRRVPGEDPRVEGARAALTLPGSDAVARALGALGVGWVAVHEGAAEVPDIASTVVHDGETVTLRRLDTPVVQTGPDTARVAGVAAGWAAYLLLALAGVGSALTRHRARIAQGRRSAATVRD